MTNAATSPRKRVFFICHDGLIYGAQKSLLLMVKHLPRDKYEIFVSFAKEGPLMDKMRELPDVTLLTHRRIQGAKHKRRPILKKLGDIAGLVFNMRRAVALARVLKTHRIDVVHSNSLVSFEGALAAKLAGIPHVWHIREPINYNNPRFRLTLGTAVTQWMVSVLSDRVVSVSNHIRQQFHPYDTRYPEKFRVVYNGIDCHQPYQRLLTQDPMTRETLNIVYTGRVSDGKNFQDVLEAFVVLKRLHGEGMPFRLRIYGHFVTPEYEEKVTQRIEQEGLEPYIQYFGYKNNVDDCFEDADIMVMPSSAEPFARSMLDALIRGVPVVGPRSGAPPEVLEHGESGFLYNPNDPEDLALCFDAIYKKKGSLAAMAPACKRRVQNHFTLEQYTKGIENLYDEILTRRPVGYDSPQTPCWDGA